MKTYIASVVVTDDCEPDGPVGKGLIIDMIEGKPHSYLAGLTFKVSNISEQRDGQPATDREQAAARSPAQVFPPGEYIADEIEARGWSQIDLAERMGGDWARNLLCVEMLIHAPDARVSIGQEVASGLAKAFGTSDQLWLNLDASWREHCKALADKCHGCGADYYFDCSIPNEIWNKAFPDGGLLCPRCIDAGLVKAGLICNQAEFYFVGKALQSRLYENSMWDAQAAARRAAERIVRRLAIIGDTAAHIEEIKQTILEELRRTP